MAGPMDIVFGFSGVVILLMVSLISIAYMAAKLFNLPNMEVFAKVELYELFISVMILLFAEGLFLFSGELSASIAGDKPFEVARTFHSRVMLQGVYPAVLYCYKMILTFSTLNTFQIRPNDSVWTWFFKICPGADMFVGMFNLLSYGLMIVMSSLNAHMFILTFIEATMKNFFLPAGVLLRFFPPTRQAGVFVITLSIAFYAVYPTTYAIHLHIMDKIAQLESGNPNAQFEPFPQLKADAIAAATLATPLVIANIVGGSSKLLDFIPIIGSKLASFTGFFASEAFMMAVQPEIFYPALNAIASLSLVTFFLPALSMVITIAFINGVTNFIERKIT